MSAREMEPLEIMCGAKLALAGAPPDKLVLEVGVDGGGGLEVGVYDGGTLTTLTFVDEDDVRRLFNWLGVYLHTR